MGYKETLATMVNNSGLTLREIADKCGANGTPLDPSYISKLQKGKQGPPSEEISKAIAEACGGNSDELILEGFLEKAPQPIQDFVSKMLNYIKQITVSLSEFYTTPEVASMMREQFNQVSMFELMEMLSLVLNQFKSNENAPFVLEKNEDIPELEFAPNVALNMKDNSMNPLIPQGASANIAVATDYETGDIVAVTLKDCSTIIRRLILQEDRNLLIPENKDFEVIAFPKGELQIVGKVKSITFKI